MDDFHIDTLNPSNDPLGHAIEFMNYHNLIPIGPIAEGEMCSDMKRHVIFIFNLQILLLLALCG
jgi:hypothetical protein